MTARARARKRSWTPLKASEGGEVYAAVLRSEWRVALEWQSPEA